MGKPKVKPNYRRRSLRLPDLDHCKRAVLNSLGSPASRRVYEYAIDQFIAWYCSEPRLAFNRIVVIRYRMHLESRGLAANTINQQLAAVRRLAHEAADAGLLSPELAAGISRVKGVKQLGFRAGNWLSATQSSEVLRRASGAGMRASRDFAMLALLIGCGFRRSELVGLEMAEIQVRQGHWAVVDLIGKGGHIRTAHSRVGQNGTRSVDRGSRGEGGEDISRSREDRESVGRRHLSECGLVRREDLLRESGTRSHRASRLARTCAKLCHDSGGELEQIQFLLGHVSVQTTERYLGCKQNLGSPVNDRFQLRADVPSVVVKGAIPEEAGSPEGIECHRGDQTMTNLSRPAIRNEYPKPGSLQWSRSEKAIARKAFDAALKRELHDVMQEAKRMASWIEEPSELWDLEHHLTLRRKEIDRKYDHRYSELTQVFGRLLHEKRLSEEDLRGLREDKLQSIRSFAKFLAEDVA